MILSRMFLVLGLVACKPGASPPDAPPTLAQRVAAAGEDPWKLCAFVKDHADAPEAKQALERARAAHAKALPAMKRSLAEHTIAPEIRKGLEAVIDGGAAAPCQRVIGVFVEVTPPY